MTTALLLIAHGSRNQEANADLHHVVEEMRRRGPYAIVEPAFLELASPTIEEAGARAERACVRLGRHRRRATVEDGALRLTDRRMNRVTA